MPFTPLHMGPGLAIKGLGQSYFSLMVFGWSQIAIDLQPLFVLLRDQGELHGFSHTLAGATLIALLCGLTGKPFGEFGLRVLRGAQYNPISWRVSFLSAFIGTYSHVFIDSIMHHDVEPFFPFSSYSPLYGIIDIDHLHITCLVLAAIGTTLFYLLSYLKKLKSKQ